MRESGDMNFGLCEEGNVLRLEVKIDCNRRGNKLVDGFYIKPLLSL